MTWSISISAASKATAKLQVTEILGRSMLSQRPHARDFNMVQAAIHGAIDACAEGSVTASANGYLSGTWEDGDIPAPTCVNLTLCVYSTPAPTPEVVGPGIANA
jgi:hypothetical protein